MSANYVAEKSWLRPARKRTLCLHSFFDLDVANDHPLTIESSCYLRRCRISNDCLIALRELYDYRPFRCGNEINFLMKILL